MESSKQRQSRPSERGARSSSQRNASKEASALPDIKRALASPAGVLSLQRAIGNRAVNRLVERGAATPPNAESPSSMQRAASAEGGTISEDVATDIQRASGGGRPLDQSVGASMSHALGADLGGVRVHTDAKADMLNRSLGAKAFTLGSDVFFSRGAYDPGSSGGKRLLAHELTHVAQQGAAPPNRIQAKLTVGPANDRYEEEADQVAGQVMRRAETEKSSLEDEAYPDSVGQQRGLVARSINPAGQAPEGVIQRAVGFEFQTTWGLARSLPAVPNPLNQRRTDAEPRPEHQEDWQDEQIAHPNVPTPVLYEGWQKFKRNFSRQGRAELHQANNPDPRYVSDEKYRDGNMTVTRPENQRHHLKYYKSQVLKDYGGYKMTVDDAGTALGAELEWVVDPPVQESADVGVLEDIMNRLYVTVTKLREYKDRDSFRLSQVTGSNADDQIEIQPNIKPDKATNNGMLAPAQATGGVSLDRLHTLFQELGQGKDEDEDPEATITLGSLAGAAKKQAEVAARVGSAFGGSAEIKGLVSYMARYLTMSRYQDWENVPDDARSVNQAARYAKLTTQYLARTDFKKMFSMLPAEDRELYAGPTNGGHAGGPAAFVSAIGVALTSVGMGVDMDKRVYEKGIQSGGLIKDIPITRRAWLLAIANGTGDLLGSKYQKSIGGAGIATDLESMGNLGNKADRVGDDANDPTAHTGIVMEFRGDTSAKPPAEWGPYAVGIFKYLKALNNRET